MRVYLIRHAHAVAGDEDAARPLSRRGRGQVRDLARFLKASASFAPAEVWHSPLERSRETAARLAGHLRLTAPLREAQHLKPEADPRAAVRRIKAIPHELAVVGHEPHLSALASLLVAGRPAPAVFLMRKCAILALEGAGPHWQVRWHWSPDLIA